MTGELLPIEDELRSGEELDPDAHLVMRGWPVNVIGILRNADLTMRRFSMDGKPFVAISAEVTIPGWDVETILDPIEPFLARVVVDIVDGPRGTSVVHLEVLGVPEAMVDELRRANLLPQ